MMFYAEGYSETCLEELPINKCVWLALAAATRQSINYARLPSSHRAGFDIRALLAAVWEAAAKGDLEFCQLTLDSVIAALPSEDADNSAEVIVAENCLLSLAYALRCKLTGVSKEAHWALMKAYDAADQMALILWRKRNGEDFTEGEIRAMPVVQRELAQQAAAFETVAANSDFESFALLRDISFAVEFATDEEWLALHGGLRPETAIERI